MDGNYRKSYSYADEIANDRARMAAKRQASRDLVIPACANPRRRRRCERDPKLWLATYCPSVFYNPFGRSQSKLVDEAWHCLEYGGYKAQSAPRGSGKSSIMVYLAQLAIIIGMRAFLMFIAANTTDAKRRGRQIKLLWEKPEFALLHADYPEIAVPVQALGGSSRRAATQTVANERTFIEWGDNSIIFPTIPGSKASGAKIFCVGIEGGIRGQSEGSLRPDAVIIDDPETRQSLRSAAETQRIADTIDTDIVGLEGPDGGISIFLACTIAKAGCIADRYTDPTIKPAWRGERARLILQFPRDMSLSDQYIELRREDRLKRDKDARRAHQFFIDNLTAITDGVIVDDEFRFSKKILPDGSQVEVHPYQFALNKIADTSWDAFNSEYQSEPPAETAPESLQIIASDVANRLSHVPRLQVPANTDFLTAGVDVGGRALHYTVFACKDAVAHVIDHDAIRVLSPITGKLAGPNASRENIQATQTAILTALLELRDRFAEGYLDASTGELLPVRCVCVDTGYQAGTKSQAGQLNTPVYEFIRTSPVGIYRAVKGWSAGTYRQPDKGHGKTVGEGWHRVAMPAKGIHLYHVDSDHFKLAVHDGFDTPPQQPGSIILYGSEPLPHDEYSKQITAEEYQTIFEPGKGYTSKWIIHSKNNHFLDATAYARAAAAMLGLNVAVTSPEKNEKLPKPQPAATTGPAVTHNPGGGRNKPKTKSTRRVARIQRRY